MKNQINKVFLPLLFFLLQANSSCLNAQIIYEFSKEPSYAYQADKIEAFVEFNNIVEKYQTSLFRLTERFSSSLSGDVWTDYNGVYFNYNDNGLVIRESFSTVDRVYEYNGDGLISNYIEFVEHTGATIEYRYTYNASGQLTQFLALSHFGYPDTNYQRLFFYNSSGSLDSSCYQDYKEGVFMSTTKVSFTKLNNAYQVDYYSLNQETEVWEYDYRFLYYFSDGNLVAGTYTAINDNISYPQDSTIFSYDERDSLIFRGIIYYNSMDSSWNMYSYLTREFDEYNFLKREVYFNTDYSTLTTDTNSILDYVFDSLGYLQKITTLTSYENKWDPYSVKEYSYDEQHNLIYISDFTRDNYLFISQDSILMRSQGRYHFIYDYQEEHEDLYIDEIISASIYPNPFSDYIHFFIKTSGHGILKLSVYDVHGRIIYSDLLQVMDNYFISTVWLSELPSNQMYFYSIISNDSAFNGGIIKQ